MRTSLVLTLIGDDRPGIVEQLSNEVLGAGANWEESRMARLAGKFAGVLRVSVDADRADALSRQLMTLQTGGLRVIVERTDQSAEQPSFTTLGMQLVGNDRPGIVRDISRVLAERHVNIEEMETELTTAPMSGEALFRATARLSIPQSVSPQDLRAVLESLADDLMVDLKLEE